MNKRTTITCLATFAAAALAGAAEANSPASSTMHFEGTLTDAGGGVYTGVIPATAGEYYVPGGLGAAISTGGGFDVYAWEHHRAYVQGSVPEHAPIGPDHDAYSQSGPWGVWYDPDVADWDQYELELTLDHWYLRYASTQESPMSGTIDWVKGLAHETDLGTQERPPGYPPHGGHGGSAAHGGGPQAWDWDNGWGVEVIPLQTAAFRLIITDLGGGDYHVAMMPDANTIASSTMVFEGTGTMRGPVVTGFFPLVEGEYYVPGGLGEPVWDSGGYDIYAREGAPAYVSSYVPPTADVNPDHDAWTAAGPWEEWYDPDFADYYNYTLVLGTDTWYMQHGYPTGGRPMGGTMDWTSMYATETETGTHPNPGNDGDAAANGGGPRAWDCDWTWGSEAVPLEFPGYSVDIQTTVGRAFHTITLTPAPGLNLSAQLACHPDGEKVVVDVNMPDMPAVIVGGQFFLLYDDTKLSLDGIVPGDTPFTVEVHSDTGTSGVIEYAVHIPVLGGSGTSSATTMATATFTPLVELCTATADLVTWDTAHVPPSRLTDDVGADYQPTLDNLGAITVDQTAPVITCLSDVTVNADVGLCTAVVDPGSASAIDNCSPPLGVSVSGLRDDFLPLTDPYPAGTTTITWTATDECGNSSQCPQTVTVNAVNDMVLDVSLENVFESTVDRCITLELWKCPATVPVEIVELDLTFTSPGSPTDGYFVGTVEVPCGDYDCITARDKLHTLRRTITPLPTAGNAWDVDFTTGGSLPGGNLNDDDWIDILDFGVFIGQFGDLPDPDTDCLDGGPHADISGNGEVGTEDYTYIWFHFLETHEDNCCGAPMPMLGWRRPLPQSFNPPITRISVQELRRRGLHNLIPGDLNQDGWLDVGDMEAFANGVRP